MPKMNVYFDGNGSGLIMVAGMGEYMPLKDHQAMVKECEEKSKAIFDATVERDALAAQAAAYKERSSELYKLCDELIDHLRYNKAERDEVLNEFWNKQEAIKHVPSDPQQHLAEIKAAAGRAGFVAGINYLDKVWCKDATSDVAIAADEYAAKARKGGE